MRASAQICVNNGECRLTKHAESQRNTQLNVQSKMVWLEKLEHAELTMPVFNVCCVSKQGIVCIKRDININIKINIHINIFKYIREQK